MQQRYSLHNLFCLAVLLALVTGCGQSTSSNNSSGTQNPCERASSIRGTVVTISHTASGKLIGGFLLDGTKENQALFDSVYVNVDNATQLFEKQQNECRTLSFPDLKPGQRVQVQSTGIATQSYPPQIQATEVVILPPQA
jgi:hypothetical protein